MPEEELPFYLHWVKFLDWLLSRTEKFPRRMRLSLSNRLENLALDFLQDLVEARYTREKTATLRRMNLRLEQLRVLLKKAGVRVSVRRPCRRRSVSRAPSGRIRLGAPTPFCVSSTPAHGAGASPRR